MKPATRVEHVMGTAVRFVTEVGDAHDAIEETVAWLHWVDRTFSVHRPDSQIMQIRRGDNVDIHPEVTAVLDRCMALRIVSDGAFDHRPEGDLDPSGYVKGWAIERTTARLEETGLGRFYIDAGGDIAARGRWRVGIRNPQDLEQSLIGVDLSDQAIATSGAYERGAHIWGDHSGDTASVSVIGPDLGTADAISTALYASQRQNDGWLERFPGYEVIVITNDLEVRTTAGVSTDPSGLFRVHGDT